MASRSDGVTPAAEPRFNEVIHSPIRFQIGGLLAARGSTRFSEVQTELGIADSHLSKNIRVLIEAGLVEQCKGAERVDNRYRTVTVLALTPAGHDAYLAHAAWIEQIIHGR